MKTQLERVSEFLEVLEVEALSEAHLEFLTVGGSGSGSGSIANNCDCRNSNQASCPKATENNCTCKNG